MFDEITYHENRKNLILIGFIVGLIALTVGSYAYDWKVPGNLDGQAYFNVSNFEWVSGRVFNLSGVSRTTWVTDSDTNASSICSGGQILLGNGSCVADTNYLDDTTIADTDTNASSICSTDQVLLGNGSCVASSGYYDDTYNTSSEIWIVIDNITFIKWADSLPWANLSGVPALGNTSAEIWFVIDNTTFIKWTDQIPWNNLTGVPALGNTTAEIWNVVDNETFIKWSQQIPWANLTNVPALGNTSTEIWVVVDNETFIKWSESIPWNNLTGVPQLGNTSAEIWGVIDNGTFQVANGTFYLEVYTYTGTLGYANITPCSNGEILKVSGGVWACGADVSGGGGGVGIWMATGSWMTPNASAGGQQNVNVTGYVNASIFDSSSDEWCNTTNCYSIADFLLDTDTDTHRGNTSQEISAVIITDGYWNNSFLIECANITGNTSDLCTIADTDTHRGNTTAEIIAVTNNTADWRATTFFGNLACGYLTGNTSDLCAITDTDTHRGNTSAEMIAATNSSAQWNASLLSGILSCKYIADNTSDICSLVDTTIADTDTNASSICSGVEVLLGNTSCYSSANWDVAYGWGDHSGVGYLTSYTDTNASSICSGGTTYLDGEGNCDDISGIYVQAADWTTIDNYPSACGGGLVVRGFGDILHILI